MGSTQGVPGGGGGGVIRRGSIVVGNKAAISPQEYLEHVDAVRTAWRYAAAQTIHDIRLAKRMKKQKKYGHFSMEQWGRTSRVFEKFFWFHSHMFIQYFLQGAVFCTSIYFAAIGQFGELYLFTQANFDEKLPLVVLLFVSMGLVILVGLFIFVPAILMQYTMVMHLAQLHSSSVVREAVEDAKRENEKLKAKAAKAEARARSHEAAQGRLGKLWEACTWDNYDAAVNGRKALYFFLTLLLVDFFISVLSSVVRQDLYDYCFVECIAACAGHVRGLPSIVVTHLANCTATSASSSSYAAGGSAAAAGRSASRSRSASCTSSSRRRRRWASRSPTS